MTSIGSGGPRLRGPEKPRRAWKSRGPRQADIGSKRRDFSDRALGQVAFDGRLAIDVPLAEPRREPVYERAEVRFGVVAAEPLCTCLFRRERLHSGRDQQAIAIRLPESCGPTMPRRPPAFGSSSDAVSILRTGRRCWSIPQIAPPTAGFAGFCRSVRGGLVRELAGSAGTMWPRGAKDRLSFSCRAGSTTRLPVACGG